MRRFFFDPSCRKGDRVTLSEEESRHISKVLRLQAGDSIELLDGLGALYQAVIASGGRKLEANIERLVSKERDRSVPIHVLQGILKGEKMDMVVQKCTELGVTGMVPFQSSRCQGKLGSMQAEKKHQRWQRIGLSACKQCMRLQTMQIAVPKAYSEALAEPGLEKELQTRPASEQGGDYEPLRLLFWEEEKTTHLHDIKDLDQASSVGLMLGPEGGFTEGEVEEARQQGWQTVGLGERILRAETATLSAVSIVQYLTGNL